MIERSEHAFHDFERAGWERAAEHYGIAFASLTVQTAPAIFDAVSLRVGTRLLDVATGPGVLAAAAAARGAIATGLDFSSAMIADARRRHAAVTFRDGDAQQLPFADGTFDAVVMNFGMLHLARPERAIAEAHRVLSPGGRYAFTVWAAPDQALGFGMVLRAIEKYGRSEVGLPEGPAFFKFSDAAESRRALEAVGFADVRISTLPLAWQLASADDVFEALSKGGVRTAATLRAQTPEVFEKIRTTVRQQVERYSVAGGFEVPMPAVLSVATRV
jgi:ubiquinone/menaquinone biosynthesis C-methylase UbiE